MKTLTSLFLFLSLVTSNIIFAQSSGILIAASIEDREIAYFNQSQSINAQTFNIGIDKCFGGNWVLYTGFRYTKSNDKHTCNECGVYSHIEREVVSSNPSPKSYYWYEESVEKVGVPISLKYYLPSNIDLQFFVEGGALFNFFSHAVWEGEYWQNDVTTQTAILGPFEEKDEGTKVGVVDISGIFAIGAELALAEDWALILKPYAQYEGYWTFGGMMGVKRVFAKR